MHTRMLLPLFLYILFVTVSAKPALFKQACILEKNFKLFVKLHMHATGKYSQGLMGQAISEGNSNSTKTIYHLTCLVMESSKSLFCFCIRSLNGKCVTYICYNVVGVNKIVAISLSKLPP